MAISLRYYQADALNGLWGYLTSQPGNPLVAMPTGTGKSIVIAEFVRYVVQNFPGCRVLMLTHVKELIEQNFSKLVSVWPTAPAGIFSAGLGQKDTMFPITYAGIQSIYGHAETFGRIDIVLVDEAHLISDKANGMYGKFLAELRKTNPTLRVVGLSATPYRMGLGMLTEGGMFDGVAYDNTKKEDFVRLIREGFLAPLRAKRTETQLDTDSVKISGGEFVLADLQQKCNIDDTNMRAIRETVALAADRKSWLVFGTGTVHCEALSDVLNRLGIPSTFVHSKITDKERDERIAAFKDGHIKALVNMGVLTTGFDHPGLDCIVMLRPTRSPGLWVQMLGRGTRPSPGKNDCLVLDFAGNTARLGPINDPVLPKKKGKGGGGAAPVKVCAQCFTFLHLSVRECPHCGYLFPTNDRGLKATASTLDLIADAGLKIKDYTPTGIYVCRHEKPGKPDSLRVDINCGLSTVFSIYLCLEHGGWATQKSCEQWHKLAGTPCPATVTEALERKEEIRLPALVKAYKGEGKKKYEMLDYMMELV